MILLNSSHFWLRLFPSESFPSAPDWIKRFFSGCLNFGLFSACITLVRQGVAPTRSETSEPILEGATGAIARKSPD
jgi:hypothetical protein